MKLTFWGTGTSTGVPMVGCDCTVCRSTDPRNRRQRASVLLSQGDRHWLIDAGPDFRSQALRADLRSLEAVLLTHGHADHILGLDDLRPLSWKRTLDVWADAATTAVVERTFSYFFGPGDGKTSRPRLSFHPLVPAQPTSVGGLSVLPVPIQHGDATILGFRIGDLAYLTDCNGIPEASLALLKGLEVLVLGALRPSPHPTHFSLDEAEATAHRVGARSTWFTHFSHDVDHETWARRLPRGMAPAFDGLELSFNA